LHHLAILVPRADHLTEDPGKEKGQVSLRHLALKIVLLGNQRVSQAQGVQQQARPLDRQTPAVLLLSVISGLKEIHQCLKGSMA
jgi:hypothetical protein